MAKDTKKTWRPVIAAAIVAVAVIGVAVWQATGPGVWGGPRSIHNLTEQEREALADQRAEAYTQIQTGKLHLARPILEKLVGRYPDDAESHMLLARTLLGLEDIDAAVRHFGRAIELDDPRQPTNHEARYNLAVIALKRDDPELARTYLVQAAEIKPRDPRYAVLLAQAWMDLERYEPATIQLLRALEINSNLPEAHGRLAEIYARERKWNLAIGQTDKAIILLDEHAPDRALKYKLLKAQYLRRANQMNAALNVLTALDPEVQLHEPVVEQIARCYMKLGEPQRAALRWVDLFQQEPDNARAAAEAAFAFHKADRPDEARKYLGLAQKVDPRHERVKEMAAALGGP